MVKNVKIIALILSLLLVSMAFVGCSKLTLSRNIDTTVPSGDVPQMSIDEMINTSYLLYPAVEGNYRYNVYTHYVTITEYLGTENEKITIPATIEDRPVIGLASYAFVSAPVTNVIIPEGIVSIGESCFAGCESLAEVTIAPTITSIGEGAFSGCISLKKIAIPPSITVLPENMCYGCSSLEYIVIQDGNNDVFISNGSFERCGLLKKAWIPRNVTSIGETAFRDSTSTIVIYGYNASTAAVFAANYLLDFVLIDEEATTKTYAETDFVNTPDASRQTTTLNG